MAEIVFDGITKRFGRTAAVAGLTLAVRDGEFVVLLGPTGAGKTTTLRLAAGLEAPDEGTIHVGGQDVTRAAPHARNMAFVFQQYSLYPHLSVYDNLAFPLRSPLRRWPEDRIRTKVNEVAGMLRIAHKLQNRATHLSGGEMQRVAIGRALVRSPAAYLMDEPLSSLDAKLREDLRMELKRIQIELGTTLLYVTHDQVEAMTMADRIGVLSEGRLVQLGTPREVYETPQSVYVAQRLGTPRMNLVPVGVLGLAGAPRGAATIGVRPEQLHVGRSDRNAPSRARVVSVEHMGAETVILLEAEGHRLHAYADPDHPVSVDDDVWLEVDRAAALCFDSAGNRIPNGGS